ncbi:MAG: histidinol-phosphate transaminase [Chloroflexota bacterium]
MPDSRRQPDPLALLRLHGSVAPYPVEPSDSQVAAAAGIPVGEVVRFDLNTLGGGPLPGVTAALAGLDLRAVLEYGDPSYAQLRARISELVAAPPERIVPGAGADELIRLITAMVAGPGDAVLILTPAFAMYAVEARLAGATVVEVPRRDPAQRQSVAAIRDVVAATDARLVWLCTPNNPTADHYPLDEVAAIADGLPALVAVDAVYQEFAEVTLGLSDEALSAIPLQAELPNLIVLRSLAKAYGLAGARVGYLVAPEPLAGRFDAARLPLPIGSPSEVAALGALGDRAAARARHAQIVAERDRLAAALGRLGCEVLPSVTNFVLVRPLNARRLESDLALRGLVVRAYPDGPLVDWLRITARDAAENGRLIAALDDLLG